jgi:hypothetical protein
LTLAQDFTQTRNCFVHHKRVPFLWLVILGPLMFFATNMWGLFVFPPSGAIRAINQLLPNAKVILEHKNFPKCGRRTYLFGYDFRAEDIGRDGDPDFARVCRDIVGSVWIVDIDPKHK